MLAYVGLRQGDAVGLMTMSGQHLWLAPRKSQAMVSHILNQVYGLQPGLLTSDYYQAAVALSTRLKKRALVVLISNLRDEDDATPRCPRCGCCRSGTWCCSPACAGAPWTRPPPQR